MKMLLQVPVVSVLHLNTIITFLLFIPQEAGASPSKPGCAEKCGNITIPYPFGMEEGCHLNRDFAITCNISYNPPLPFLLGVEILEISEENLRINDTAYRSCFNNQSGRTDSPFVFYNKTRRFSYSYNLNKFIAIGCDIFAYISGADSKTYTTGCASLCKTFKDIAAGFSPAGCNGIGCCRTILRADMASFYLRIRSINMLKPTWSSQPCSLAFVTEMNFSIPQNFKIFSIFDKPTYSVPAVLDWSVGEVSCHEAMGRKNYACGQNTYCSNGIQGLGYNCHCLKGYQGNPYLADGCQDINECDNPNKNLCLEMAPCSNIPGSYLCICPTGHHGDGKKNGTGCIRGKRKHMLPLAFSLGVGIIVVPLILIAAGLWSYRELEQRKKRKVKEKFFKKNGGLLLQQQISSSKGSVEKTKLYSVEELEKATDDFSSSRVLGKGGLGTVYKGMLSDGSIVAIKKSNTLDERQLAQFVNEVLILSQINHRHIVRLLGCCLETEVPLLVYEYVSNGTLSRHLLDEEHGSKVSWETRLRIASEIAGALAYLHSYASIPICHRDIKSSNILLDENFRAVVSDFGLSKSIPLDKTHLTALVQGTFGYLDPDYFHSGQFTDKSDVYAFGVVLAELLTGEQAISLGRSEQSLANYFRLAMKQNHLLEIVDKQIANEGQEEEILAVAKISKRCIKLNGKKRPTMKQVEIELQQLGRFQEQLSFQKTKIQEPPLPMEEQTCHEDYCSISERSHSYTFGPVTEEII